MDLHRPSVLMIALLIAGLGSGCSCQADPGAQKPQVQVSDNAELEKSIRDQQAKIKELREQNEELRRQLNATTPANASAPAKP